MRIEVKDNRVASFMVALLEAGRIGFNVRESYDKSFVNARYQDGRTLLQAALQYGNEAIVLALLNAGAEFNTQDPDGNFPLDIARERGLSNVVNVILSSK